MKNALRISIEKTLMELNNLSLSKELIISGNFTKADLQHVNFAIETDTLTEAGLQTRKELILTDYINRFYREILSYLDLGESVILIGSKKEEKDLFLDWRVKILADFENRG